MKYCERKTLFRMKKEDEQASFKGTRMGIYLGLGPHPARALGHRTSCPPLRAGTDRSTTTAHVYIYIYIIYIYIHIEYVYMSSCAKVKSACTYI